MRKLGWLSLLFVSAALQAAPSPPEVRVRAAPKQLIFDWAPAPDAGLYELWYRATTNAPWRKLKERPFGESSTTIAVSVHLIDWREARFRIDACDFAGCTPSSEIAVDQLMRYPVGYFKPETLREGQQFGSAVALSADGRTMAIASGSFYYSVTLSVSLYRRVGSTWMFDANIVPQPAAITQLGLNDWHTLALSGDGSTLAIGTPDEPLPTDNRSRGATHIYRRINGAWQFAQKLVPTDRTQYSRVGHVVEMDDAGERIAVMVMDSIGSHMGEVHLYRNVGAGWVIEKIFPVPPREPGAFWFCQALALSGDGQRLTRQCGRSRPVDETYVDTYTAPDWNAGPDLVIAKDFNLWPAIDLNGDGTLLVASVAANDTAIWRWTGAGWQPDGPNGTAAVIRFSEHTVTISRNGNFVAIGAERDNTLGLGVVYPPFSSGYELTGSVRIFERRGGAWPLVRTLKSNTSTRQWFGHSLALGDNGSVLAVGAPDDSSDATGIDGDQNDTSARSSGAVWLY